MKFPDIDKPLPEHLELIAVAIAKATHEFWLLDMTRRGWKPALETNNEAREHAWLVGWKRLPKQVQEDYISRARAMPFIIYRAGFEIILTAGGMLDLVSKLIKNRGRVDGAIDGGRKRKRTAAESEPGNSGRKAIEPEKPGASKQGPRESSGRSEETTGSGSGDGGRANRESSKGGTGEEGSGE